MNQIERSAGPGDEKQFDRRIAHDYFCRIHMSMILAAVIASGVLASRGLLKTGLFSLRLRYPLAVLTSYLVFLTLVRLWIWYVTIRNSGRGGFGGFDFGSGGGGNSSGGWFGFGSSRGGSTGGAVDGMKFGGGSSGGGGATGSWDGEAGESLSGSGSSGPASSGWFPSFNFDFDLDDGWWILLLLALLVGAILGAGGYLVYAAPNILPDAAFQAVVVSSLTRISKQEHHGWMSGVLRATWIPFLAVLVFATALGWEAHRHCPSAQRLIEALNCPVS